MPTRLDPTAPVPLYHQLAEALRYQIATGTLKPGDSLPSLREAAAKWKVNLHTVRHAYAELSAHGFVRTAGSRSTQVVADSKSNAAKGQAEKFLEKIVREAAEKHRMSVDQLRDRLAHFGRPLEKATPDAVYSIECSETQAADIAGQIAGAWTVEAHGWSLERPGAPPAGTVIATYFHYNEIRTRWPALFPQIRFVAIHPDPGVARQLSGFARKGRATRALVCERTESMALNIAADLTAVLPQRKFDLEPHVSDDPAACLEMKGLTGPVLFPPRVWGSLTPSQRADKRAVEVRYLIESRDLSSLGADLGWQPRLS